MAARFDDAAREVHVAFRGLARRPAFAAAVLATLAIGIGAPTMVFAVLQAVLLEPLPFPAYDRLVQFRLEGRGPQRAMTFEALPVSTALEWRAASATLSGLAIFTDRALTMASADGPVRLTGVAATPDFFEVLGVPPAMGRTFGVDSSGSRDIVLSQAAWRSYLAADPAAIGRTIALDGEPYRVIGVMPERFRFPTPDTSFWTPRVFQPGAGRGMLLPVIARLGDRVTLAAAVDEGRRLMTAADPAGAGGLNGRTLHDQIVGGVRRTLWMAMAAVAVVSLLATVNVALLWLTRGATRGREFALRLAVGASSLRIIRLLAVESLCIAALGGAAGLLMAALGVELLRHFAPPDTPRLSEIGLDPGVVAFCGLLTAGTSVIFGALSAGRALGSRDLRSLGAGGRDSQSGGSRTERHRLNVIAAGEIALSLVLLIAAALLLRSFLSALLVDHGFDGRNTVACQITLPSARYPTAAMRLAFHEELLSRLTQAPGIEVVGLTTSMPNRQPSARFNYFAGGVPQILDPLSNANTEMRTVSEGFLEAMGVPLLTGRGFLATDAVGRDPVIVIAARTARHHFPDRPAVGEWLHSETGDRRVIGVVGDVRPAAPGADLGAAAYLPLRQDEGTFRWYATVTIVARGANAAQQLPVLRQLIHSLDPQLPLFNVRTLEDEVSRLTAGPRFNAATLAAFASLALLLAAVGVYGVLAYTTSGRTREIGVRMALGATRSQVRWLILRDAARVVGAGLAVGLGSAVVLSHGLAAWIADVASPDVTILAVVTLVVAVTGVLAAYFPARRATRVNALDALRQD